MSIFLPSMQRHVRQRMASWTLAATSGAARRGVAKRVAIGLLATLLPVAFLESVNLATGNEFYWRAFGARWLFVIGVILTAQQTQPYLQNGKRWTWPLRTVGLAGMGIVADVIY